MLKGSPCNGSACPAGVVSWQSESTEYTRAGYQGRNENAAGTRPALQRPLREQVQGFRALSARAETAVQPPNSSSHLTGSCLALFCAVINVSSTRSYVTGRTSPSYTALLCSLLYVRITFDASAYLAAADPHSWPLQLQVCRKQRHKPALTVAADSRSGRKAGAATTSAPLLHFSIPSGDSRAERRIIRGGVGERPLSRSGNDWGATVRLDRWICLLHTVRYAGFWPPPGETHIRLGRLWKLDTGTHTCAWRSMSC